MQLETLYSLRGEDSECLKILLNPKSNNLIIILNKVRVALEIYPSGLMSAIKNILYTDSTFEPFQLETFHGFINKQDEFFIIKIFGEEIKIMPLEIDKFKMVFIKHY